MAHTHTLGLLVCLFKIHCYLDGRVSSHLTLEVPDWAGWAYFCSTSSFFLKGQWSFQLHPRKLHLSTTQFCWQFQGYSKAPSLVPDLLSNDSPLQWTATPLPSSRASVWGVHVSPVFCINARTVEESCEDTSISTNGVQGQCDPIHRGEQEDRKGKYKCLMIAFSNTAIYPQNSTEGKANMFLKVLYITQIIKKF